MIDGSTGELGVIIKIDADNVVINGLEVKSGTGDMIRQDNPRSGTVVKYCIIHDGNGDEGVQLKKSTSGILEYNYVYDIAFPGDALNISGGSSGGKIRYNEVYDIGSQNAAIYVYDSTNMEIVGNLVYHVTQNDGIKLGTKGGGDASKTGGLIKDNVVYDTEQDGITVYMSGVIIEGNKVYNSRSENGAVYLAYAISNIDIRGNSVHDNVFKTSKRLTTAGILLENRVDATSVTVNFNNIYNNTPYGVTNETTALLNVTQNWWGTAVRTTINENISGNVNFDPYWVNEAKTILSNAELSIIYVDDDYTDGNAGDHRFGYDAFATIQEGIDAVVTGGTVNVSAGTYVQTGNLVIDKQIALIGISNPKPTIQFDGKCDNISIEADDVILENLRFYKTDTEVGWQGSPTCAANVLLGMPKGGPPNYLSLYGGLIIRDSIFEGSRYAMYINSKGDFTVEDSEFVNSGGNYATIHIAAFDGTVNILRNSFGVGLERAIVVEPGPDGQILYGGTMNIIGNTVTGKKSFFVYNHWQDNSKKINLNLENNNITGSTNSAIIFFACGDISLDKFDKIRIKNNTITGSSENGIFADATSCPLWGIPTTVSGSPNEFSVNYNNIYGSVGYGIKNDFSSTTANTTNNWWGSAKPDFASVVSGNVNYSPWYANQEMTSLAGTPDKNNQLTLPTEVDINVTTTIGDVTVEMPAGLTVTGEEDWTGEINAPEVKEISSVTIVPGSGTTVSVSTVIEIGYGDIKLTFNKAVRISIANQAGKYAGYSRAGVFTPITTTCIDDDQAIVDAQLGPEGDCKIDVGSDLVIWTKHFTKFVTYSQTTVPPPSSGGGGGAVVIFTGDITAPSISEIDVVAGSNTAIITWQTNEQSISWLVYGETTTYGEEVKTTTYITSHSVTLENLNPSTTYHYQIKSKDNSGNIGTHTDRIFTTSALKEEITGDINDDGKVNIFDFNLLMVNWGDSPSNLTADLDDNGMVDVSDFNLLIVNWIK